MGRRGSQAPEVLVRLRHLTREEEPRRKAGGLGVSDGLRPGHSRMTELKKLVQQLKREGWAGSRENQIARQRGRKGQ